MCGIEFGNLLPQSTCNVLTTAAYHRKEAKKKKKMHQQLLKYILVEHPEQVQHKKLEAECHDFTTRSLVYFIYVL